jgi:fluoride ion exporter CrcB/FEX
MPGLLLAGMGGFIGAAARYAVGIALVRTSAALVFPLATLIVNVAGLHAGDDIAFHDPVLL